MKERNGRQGLYFKERMRRGETVVSFPRTLRLDEKTAMKSKVGHIFRELKQSEVFPDLRVILYLVYEKQQPNSFWKPYLDALPPSYDNIMGLTDAELRKLLRRPGCENTHNLGVQMRRTFNRFYGQYKQLVEPNYKELQFTREELLWGFNTLVCNGWGSGADGTGDKMMVPLSDLPNHRREAAQKAINRGFISAAKEYQSGEELTFDYGLLNDAVLAYYGQPTPDCRGLKR
jgi:histone-lysine N-methyltransferase SETD3